MRRLQEIYGVIYVIALKADTYWYDPLRRYRDNERFSKSIEEFEMSF